MQYKQTIRTLLALPVILCAMTTAVVAFSVPAYAQPGNENNAAAPEKDDRCDPKAEYCTPFQDKENPDNKAKDAGNGQFFIDKYIAPAVTALSALATITITGSIIFAAIQYATAGGDAGKVSAAKQRILKAILLLVFFIFFYAFMRWLLPGGGL